MSARVVNGYRYSYHKVTNPTTSVVGYITKTDMSRRRHRGRVMRRNMMRFRRWLEYSVFPVLTCAVSAIDWERISCVITVALLLLISAFFTLSLCGNLLYAVNPEAGEALSQFLIALGF